MLYIGFVIMIVALVGATFFHKSELVADDYYEQETNFQKRLDASQAANAMGEPLRIKEEGSDIVLRFPAAFAGRIVTGTAHFYSASNAGADRSFPIHLSGANEWHVPRSRLTTARYDVQVSWAAGSTDYYQTLPLNLR